MSPRVARAGLRDIQQPVAERLVLVGEELRRIVVADFPRIAEVNDHLLRMKGKLFRPTMTLLCEQASGGVDPRIVTFAAVVELIHLATLVHDDSVDHSSLRRGMPTVNALFSHQTAVIMGDYLYSRAIIELVHLGELDPLRIMARVTNDMSVGEMRQIEAHDRLAFNEADYELLIRAKTASLLSGACEIGALHGPPPLRAVLARYGMHMGMAFQITDDVIDYTQNETVTGKPGGLDLKERKVTLPLIAALPRMTPAARGRVEALMDTPDPSDAQVHEVIGLVEATGGIAYARDRAQVLAARAEAELEAVPPSPARDALRDAIAYAVERDS